MRAARSVFETKGYFDATVSDIVAESGLARGTYYLHYKDKDGIFIDLFRVLSREMHLLLNQRHKGTHRQRVEASIRDYFQYFAANQGILSCFLQTVTFKSELLKEHNEIRALSLFRIEAHINRNIALGLCNPVDARITAYALGGLLEWLSYSQFSNGFFPWGEPFEIEKLVQQVTDLWCRAVYSPEAASIDPDKKR